MKALPILFSAPMVRALLEGRKTQTRRIVKPQPRLHADGNPGWYPDGDAPHAKHYATLDHFRRGMPIDFCPYGKPGDLLYVRETVWVWGRWYKNGLTKTGRQKWRFKHDASKKHQFRHDHPWNATPKTTSRTRRAYWRRNAIHCPRWASRLTLKITDVRVQRVQEISEEDAAAEGAPMPMAPREHWSDVYSPTKWAFIDLWDSINGPDAWDRNDWVWAISFEVIQTNVDVLGRAIAGPEAA